MNPILAIGQIILSIALIAAILLQARGTGLSGTFGGDSAVYRSRRGVEKRLWQFTILLLVLFVLFAVVSFIVVADGDRVQRIAEGTSMHLTRRDYAVVGVLVLALVVLGGVLSLRPRTIPQIAIAEATASPTLPPPVVYREGVVGTPTSITPRHGTQPRRAARSSASCSSGLVRMGPQNHLRAGPRRVLERPTRRQDVDVPHPRRRGVAGRRAGDLGRRRVHGRGPQEPRRLGRRVRLLGRRRRPTRSTTRPSRSASRTPIGGFLAATTQPLLPAHLLRRDPVRRPRDQRVRHGARRQRPVRASPSWTTTKRRPRPGAASSCRRSIDAGARGHRLARLPRHARPVTLVARPHAVHRARSSCASSRTTRPRRPRSRRATSTPWRASGPRPATTVSALRRRRAHRAIRRRRCRPSCSTCARPTRSCATRGSAGRCSPRSTATGSCATCSAGTGRVPTRWCRRPRGRTTPRPRAGVIAFDREAATKSLQDAGWTEDRTARWAAPSGQGDPYQLQLLSVPADGEPAARGDGDGRPRRLDRARLRGRRRRDAGRGPRDAACAAGRSRRRSSTSARASSRTSTRCSPRPRSGPRDRTSRGTRTPTLDPLLEAARKPGTPEDRMTAWKALLAGLGDPACRCCRSPGTTKCMFVDGARRGSRRRLISDTGGPLLGCASMAPRRGPVSLRAGRSGVGPRWRNGRRAGFRYQWPQGRVGSTPSLGTTSAAVHRHRRTMHLPRWRNWYTRTFEGRMRQLIRVQVPAWAPLS